MKNRPSNFRLNPKSNLAQGLVFAGLGRNPQTSKYTDSSLYGNHGTLTNMEPVTDWVWEPTLGRWTIQLDGSNESVVISNATALQFLSDFTVSAWVKPAGANLSDTLIANLDGSAGWGVWNYAGALAVSINGIGGGSFCIAPSDMPYGQWVHLAAVYHFALDSADFYYDGVLIGSEGQTAGTLVAGSTTTHIGRQPPTAGYWWTGPLADIAAWNRVLPVAEIQQLADPSNVMLSGLILPPQHKWFPVAFISSTIPEATTTFPIYKKPRTYSTGYRLGQAYPRILSTNNYPQSRKPKEIISAVVATEQAPVSGEVKQFGSSVTSTSSLTGSLSCDKSLVSTEITTTSTLSADLTKTTSGETKTFEGEITAVSTVAETLNRARPFVGTSIDSVSTISGTLNSTKPLSGITTSTSTLSGVLSTSNPYPVLSFKLYTLDPTPDPNIVDPNCAWSVTSPLEYSGGKPVYVDFYTGYKVWFDTTSGYWYITVAGEVGNLSSHYFVSFGPEDIAQASFTGQGSWTGSNITLINIVRGLLIKDFAGGITAVSTVGGSLRTTKSFAGSVVSSTSSVSGTLNAIKELVGTPINAVSTISGNLDKQGSKDLAGTITSVSSITGNLSSTKLLAGNIDAVSTLTGDLTKTSLTIKDLAGAITALSTTSGNLSKSSLLQNTIAAVSTLTADLTKTELNIKELAGSITALSSVSSTLSLTKQFLVVDNTESTTNGNLQKSFNLSTNSIDSTSSLSANLDKFKTFDGVVSGLSTLSNASLLRSLGLSSIVDNNGGLNGVLYSGKTFVGGVTAISSLIAELTKTGEFTGATVLVDAGTRTRMYTLSAKTRSTTGSSKNRTWNTSKRSKDQLP